jgi:glycosyltransferase involved in cell wall biosynthesis
VRILIATSHRALLGGVEKYVQSLIPALIERRHAIGLLYEYPSNTAEEGIDSAAAGIPSWCSMELGMDALMRAINTWEPDVVYAQGFDDAALEQRLLSSYPSVLYAHTYYGTCVSGRKAHSWPRIQPCNRRLGVSCLSLYHARRCGGLNPLTMWQLFQIQSARHARLRDYEAVLVASRHMHREFERHGVSEGRLHLAPLPTGDGVPDASAPLPRDPRGRILFVGRLMDVKGVTNLLRALPSAASKLGRALTLTIAGEGPARAAIQSLARDLGLTVEFTGWVGSEQRSHLMREAELIAVPSLWPEPFGLVGIEAGCVGVPAVGYAVGGIPDWLIPGQSGELAPADPATPEGLAEAIVRALANPAHYHQLCVGAWEVARRFGPERHLAQLEQILTAVTSAKQLNPSLIESR